MKNFHPVLAFVILLLFLAACQGEYIPTGDVVHQSDKSVLDKEGTVYELNMLEFKWRYLAETDQVKLWGTVQNTSSEPVQGVRIIIDAYDQFDSHLGTKEAYLTPTYLAPEQRGKFDLYFHRGKWVKNVYLVYRFDSRM